MSFCLVPIAYDWRYMLLPTLLAVVVLCVLVAHAAVMRAARA